MLKNLKLRINYDQTDASNDILFNQIISESSSMVEAICSQPLFDTNLVSSFLGTGSPTLILPFYFINKINSITAPDGTVKLGTLEYYGLVQRIVSSEDFDFGKLYKLDLQVGYMSDSVPLDLQAVVLDLAIQRYNEYINNTVGIDSKTVDGSGSMASTTIKYKEILNRHAATLKKYKNTSF